MHFKNILLGSTPSISDLDDTITPGLGTPGGKLPF
jgi:hypothetical protein